MLKRHKKDIITLLSDIGVNQLANIEDIVDEIGDILNDKNFVDDNSFQGFNIADKVIILEDKNPIISSSGKPVGFSKENYGKEGRIVRFDKKTMGVCNVFVSIDGEIDSGSFMKIKKVKV